MQRELAAVSTESAPFRSLVVSIDSTSTKPSIYAGGTSTARAALTGDKGRYTQADPIEFKGGINLFAYALENPLRYKDPLGLKVYRCCAPADVAGGLVNHCWIKTDKQQTQIGFANEGQPAGTDPGGACASPFFSQTQVQIYGGNKKGTKCTEVTDVDEKCVDDATWTDKKGWGATNGAWAPWNQCQSWTDDILKKCKKKCPKNEPFPTPFGPCAKLADGTTVCAGTGI